MQSKFLLNIILNNTADANSAVDMLPKIKSDGFDGVVLSPRGETEKDYARIADMIYAARENALEVWLECSDDPKTVPGGIGAAFRDKNGGTIHTGNAPLFYEVCALEHIADVYESIKTGLPADTFEYLSGFCGRFDGLDTPAETIPWYDGIEDEFKDEYGMDPDLYVGNLFKETDGVSHLKTRYWQKIASKIAETFITPINAWCESNGKLYIPRFKTSDALGGLSSYGSCLPLNRTAGIPSVTVAKPDDFSALRTATAVHNSADAAAFVFGNAGPELSPEEFQNTIENLSECGINIFILNSCYPHLRSREISEKKLSFSRTLPWMAAMPYILEKAKKPIKEKNAKLMLIAPLSALWGLYTPGGENKAAKELLAETEKIGQKLFEMGRRFDLKNESRLENDAVFDDDGVHFEDTVYKTLLIVPGCSFTKKGNLAIEKARANGVRILHDIPKSDTEIIALDLITSRLKELIPLAVNQDNWTISPPVLNMLPLDAKPNANGDIEAVFAAGEGFIGGVELIVTDPCTALSVNGMLAARSRTDEMGTHYDITLNIIPGMNKVTISGCGETAAYLAGNFRVYGGEELYITSADGETDTDLVRCGYPFALSCASAKKIIYIEENAVHPKIKLETDGASVIEVLFDGESAGYVYGRSDTLELPPLNAEERHVVEIRCFPPAQSASYEDARFRIPNDVALIQEF